MSYVNCLKCSKCDQTYNHREIHNLCPECSAPLLVEYDLASVRGRLPVRGLLPRPMNMWRYIEVMPVDCWEEIISFGEGGTPLVRMDHSERAFEVDRLYVKDESVNPTGSFKARGLSAAITMARKLGVQKVAIPSAGNAGGALAAYATRGGLQSFVFVPEDTPDANILETEITATQLNLVKGVITDAGKIVAQNKEQEGWFDVSTLKEPYRIEGKKTMGYEIAEQLSWELPDVIFYPTGGGTGLIGMWKAFEEMEELGWIGPERPRMVCVQSSGCAPIVKAFHEGKSSAPLWENAETFASGLRVPGAVGDFLMLEILKASKGEAVEVDDKETYEAILEFGRMEGMFLCPEGAACWAAFKKLRKSGWILDSERVVIFNTGAGTKYTDSIRKFESALQSK